MQKGTKTIYVMHTERQSVQGRHNYGVDLGSGARVSIGRTRAQGITIPFGFVRKPGTNVLDTGLDQMVDNPYFAQDINNLPDDMRPGSNWISNYEEIKSYEKIDKQTLFEIYDNQPKGYYTSECASGTMAQVGVDVDAYKKNKKTFLQEFKIYLSEGTNPFSDNTSRGRLAVQVCENHPKIAKDRQSVNEDWHDFYIGTAEEAMQEQNRKINQVMDALANLKDVERNYDQYTSYQLAVVLGLIRGEASPSTVEGHLKQYVWEEKKNTQGTREQRVEQFNTMYDLLNDSRVKLYIKYLVRQAENTGVFIVDNSRNYIWRSKKGIPNLYNLGANLSGIERMFLNEYDKYDPEIDADNWFKDLENELKQNGVRCK